MSAAACAVSSTRTLWTASIFQIDATWLALSGLYALTLVVVGFRLFKEARRPLLDRDALRFWAIVFGVVALFAVNRIFNLQFLVTLAGRCEAAGEGWYGARRPFQFALIVTFAVAGAAALALAVKRTRETDRRLVLIGLCALTVLIAARAVSFHWAEAVLAFKIAGLSLNGLAEAAALAPVLAGAAHKQRRY